MPVLPNTVVEALTRGSGASVSGKHYLPNQLQDFATLAEDRGGTLIIRDADSLLPSSMSTMTSSRGRARCGGMPFTSATRS